MRYTPRKPNSKSALKLDIADKRLRQARHSYNLAVVATTVSASFISLVGAGLLVSGKASVGAGVITGGMAASLQCIQLVKDSNDRLDRILTELKDEE